MNFELKDRTILLTMAGSRAYGMNTPESDVDIKGLCIPTNEYFVGFLNKFEQTDDRNRINDSFIHLLDGECLKKAQEGELEGTVYDIRKFFRLAVDNNPNILDTLFCRDEEVLLMNSLGKEIRDNAHLFLSKKARWTFSGYARAQLKRIKTHRKWLTNPPDHEPTREEYDLPSRSNLPKDQLNAAMDAIKKKIDGWEIDYGEMCEAEKLYVQRQIEDFLAEISITSDEKFAAAARAIGYDENFIHLLQRERYYKAASTQWKQYQEWKKNRNPKRAELERKFGYDCYSDDTEFLTEHGWKKFDDIHENEKIATIYIGESLTQRKFGRIEYQFPTERFDGTFNGNMYHLYGYHIDTLVTPNHRMLIRKVERESGKKFEWKLCEAANLPDTFEIMMAPEPRYKAYKLPDLLKKQPIKGIAFMRLLGWYLSDGTCSFRKNKIKDIRISQKKGGKLCQGMTKFFNKYQEKANCSLYKYENKGCKNTYRNDSITEYVLVIRNKLVRETIYSECGHSNDKRIPRWVFSLSKRLKEAMLDAAVAGDGTIRTCGHKSIIYYSSSKSLANDIQELAMSCGFETSLYGPYKYDEDKCEMYQVHINKNAPRTKRLVRSKNVNKVVVKNQRFVCFTVPNGTLVTRRNGHVGIHGNCKHGAHLVRLMRMCREILTEGDVRVWRDDADELLEVRAGKMSYDEIVDFAETEDKAMQELYNNSSLPRSANHQKVDELCIKLVEEGLKIL